MCIIALKVAALGIFTLITLYSPIIPISLYVTVEVWFLHLPSKGSNFTLIRPLNYSLFSDHQIYPVFQLY